jgi:hypothetical protein
MSDYHCRIIRIGPSNNGNMNVMLKSSSFDSRWFVAPDYIKNEVLAVGLALLSGVGTDLIVRLDSTNQYSKIVSFYLVA